MATSAERMRTLRERARHGLRRLTNSLSADDLRVIAEHGYEGAASSDQDCRSQNCVKSRPCAQRVGL